MRSKCFTFYSYKGGSGRSTTLVNTAKHLADILNADCEHPILLVDADLESAGLTYFFHCETKFTARIKNTTLHAGKFLNTPMECFEGFKRSNTFARSNDLCYNEGKWNIANRLQTILEGYDVHKALENVKLRETIGQIFLEIVEAEERYKRALDSQERPDENDAFLHKTYNLKNLFNRLYDQNDPEKRRELIEEFLPTDSVVDVSNYFGKEKGTVKFIGVDVAFIGEHAVVRNETASRNKNTISKVCGEEGFSAILFDCGAGVQSTAHVLNHVSDVMVYCMRPTLQFVSGTATQLGNYQECLENTAISKGQGLKSVILLPTAVPAVNEQTRSLDKVSFWRIEDTVSAYKSFVDDTFCAYEQSLHEVDVFKWREVVLGTEIVNIDKLSEDAIKTLSCYASYDTMPDDARNAYNTYRRLAERLVYNAPIDIEER